MYIFSRHRHICIVYMYVVKEVLSFRGHSQLMCVARNRMRALALYTSRKKAACL